MTMVAYPADRLTERDNRSRLHIRSWEYDSPLDPEIWQGGMVRKLPVDAYVDDGFKERLPVDNGNVVRQERIY